MAKRKKASRTISAYKCCRPDGTDHRTGTLDYAAALAEGRAVEVPDAAPPTGQVCGHGIHVSPTARKTIQFGDRDRRPWRWFEGTVETGNIDVPVLDDDGRPTGRFESLPNVVERNEQKMRVRRFTPTREIFLADIFGPDFAQRIDRVKAEAATWKDIPWLKPTESATDEAVVAFVTQWRAAIDPWLKGRELPSEVEVVRTAAAEAAAEAADAEAAAAAAEAAAAVAAEAAAAEAAAAVAAEAAAEAAAADAAEAAAAEAAAAVAAEAAAAEAAKLRATGSVGTSGPIGFCAGTRGGFWPPCRGRIPPNPSSDSIGLGPCQ